MTLSSFHEEVLATRGVSPAVATLRGYRTVDGIASLTAAGFPEVQAWHLPRPGLLIPRYDLAGRRAPAQYRPDNPVIRDGRPVKYTTPLGGHSFVDALPGDGQEMMFGTRPVWVSLEGHIKADALASVGLLAVSVVGCWAWRSEKRPLPAWELLAGRPVTVVTDSDFAHSIDVPRAVSRFWLHLRRLGAKVTVAYPPSDEKVGIDDYLAAGHDLAHLQHATTAVLLHHATATTDSRGGYRAYAGVEE